MTGCRGISLWFRQGFELLTQGQASPIKKNFGVQSLQNQLHHLSPPVPHPPFLPKGTLTAGARHVPGAILSPIIIPILQMQKEVAAPSS